MTVDQIRRTVAEIDPTATHYYSNEVERDYTCWHEYRREPLIGDGDEAEHGWRFQIDRFTKHEDDPMVDHILRGLRARRRFAVTHLVQYERDSGYIHHIFQCRAV